MRKNISITYPVCVLGKIFSYEGKTTCDPIVSQISPIDFFLVCIRYKVKMASH